MRLDRRLDSQPHLYMLNGGRRLDRGLMILPGTIPSKLEMWMHNECGDTNLANFYFGIPPQVSLYQYPTHRSLQSKYIHYATNCVHIIKILKCVPIGR